MLDGGYELDLDAIHMNVEEAEIVSLYFPLLRSTLLVDTRTLASGDDVVTQPFVRVVPMVRNTQERLETLDELRPELPRPRSITLIPWQRSVDALTRDGVWQRLLARLEPPGSTPSALVRSAALRCLVELHALEREELHCAVTGLHYRTLWGVAGASDEG